MLHSLAPSRAYFWIIATSISILFLIIGIRYFDTSFPLVNVDIKLDRKTALATAYTFAQTHHLPSVDYEQAAEFFVHERIKNFIELEGGGKEALSLIIKENHFSPYEWQVRHFKEHTVEEVLFFIKPNGTIYGFDHTISETAQGAALSKDAALEIALKQSALLFNEDINDYSLIESSQEIKVSGRIDHAFLYQRNNKPIKEGNYRISMRVSGDKLTRYVHFIHIPEAFNRRYAHMRSINDLIGSGATILFIILYVFIGMGVALFFGIRYRLIHFKPALYAAAFLATILFIAQVTQFPLLWMHYNTALARTTVYFEFIFSLIQSFSSNIVLSLIVFAAAELLTRLAFPSQLYVWTLWKERIAATKTVFGQTLGGYLLIGFDIGFVVCIYMVGSAYFNWWTPSSTLMDPNILAVYAPWIDAIAQSLRAAALEECLFRAVPIAGSLLIGRLLKKEKTFFTIGFIAQAIIFGAAHATYPSQPAFARIVELFIPSCIFGFLYSVYGLLPSILAHFIYDVVWFSLPLFISRASGMWRNQLMVIVSALIPLCIVLYARIKKGYWLTVPTDAYNEAHMQVVNEKKETQVNEPLKVYTPSMRTSTIALLMSISCILLFRYMPRTHDSVQPAMLINKAHTISDHFIMEKALFNPASWTPLTYLSMPETKSMQFAWQTDKAWYKRILGSYIKTPTWITRYLQFDGDIAQRAEEYRTFINETNTVSRYSHILAETTPGASITESEARIIAYRFIQEKYGLNNNAVEEISAQSNKKPNRLDWTFTFKDIANSAYDAATALHEGAQARIQITIAGNTVIDSSPYLFIPEEWQRTMHHQESIYRLINHTGMTFLYTLIGLCCIRALLWWIHGSFSVLTFLIIFILLVLKSCLLLWNILPMVTIYISTDKSLYGQLFRIIGMTSVFMLAKNFCYALLCAFVLSAKRMQSVYVTPLMRFLPGVVWGLIMLAAQSLILYYVKHPAIPYVPDYTYMATRIPLLHILFDVITFTIIGSSILFCAYYLLQELHITMRTWPLTISACLFIAYGLHATNPIEYLPYFILSVLITTLLLGLSLKYTRYDIDIAPIMFGTFMIGNCIQQCIWQVFPSACMGYAITIVLIVISIVAWIYHRTLPINKL